MFIEASRCFLLSVLEASHYICWLSFHCFCLPVGGCDVRNSSNSFALRWRVFSSEVTKLKWFCFDLALKLALYTYKKKKKKKKQKSSHNTVCVTYKAK